MVPVSTNARCMALTVERGPGAAFGFHGRVLYVSLA